MADGIELLDIAPTFVVSNMKSALAFYEGVLGFETLYLHGEPPTYAVLKQGAAHIHLFPKHLEHQQPGYSNCYIQVTGVDHLYQGLQTLGVPIVHELQEQEYGMKDFVIQDPDGNHIGFGEEC